MLGAAVQRDMGQSPNPQQGNERERSETGHDDGDCLDGQLQPEVEPANPATATAGRVTRRRRRRRRQAVALASPRLDAATLAQRLSPRAPRPLGADEDRGGIKSRRT